jgi:hypothetical protein
MPSTTSRRFGYADDWALTCQHRTFEAGESTLSSDLDKLGQYFRNWRLQPNASKTEVTCFHLNNRDANKSLNVTFEGELLNHNVNPKYLGVTLDRTLSFREHLGKLSAKIKTRNNIIHKLAGTSWGSTAETLRISALSLVHSAAEYASPVWMNSSHTGLVDVQLNNTLSSISGTLRSTPTCWLPTLSHIAPHDLRRQNAVLKEYEKLLKNPELPSGPDLEHHLRSNRLKSRNPPLKTAKNLYESNFDTMDAWKVRWEASDAVNHSMPCISVKPPGFDQPRRLWSALNRIRTGHGRCADFFHKCGWLDSPACDCGAEKQTVHHIVSECSLRAYAGCPTDFFAMNRSATEYILNIDINL